MCSLLYLDEGGEGLEGGGERDREETDRERQVDVVNLLSFLRDVQCCTARPGGRCTVSFVVNCRVVVS